MKKLLLGGFILAILAWSIGFCAFAHQIYAYPQDDKSKTEAIIVLTGGKNRTTEAGKLYNRKLGDKLFISGVNKQVSLGQIEKRNEIKLKSKSKVELGQKARDTIGNAEESVEWINQNHIKSVRLVTSNYHIPRSLLEFKSRLPDLEIIAYPVYSENVQQQWWKSWGSFALFANEYNKFLYVWLKNKLIINKD